MFIRTKNFNEYVNSDDIVSLRSKTFKKDNGETFTTVSAVLRNETVVLFGDDLDEVVAQAMPVIPATAGYEALWTVRYDDDPVLGVIRHPVLGWRADPYGGLKPVTLDEGKVSNADFGGVRYPDGQVIVVGDARYKNEEEWFEEMQEYEVQRRAGKAVA